MYVFFLFLVRLYTPFVLPRLDVFDITLNRLCVVDYPLSDMHITINKLVIHINA